MSLSILRCTIKQCAFKFWLIKLTTKIYKNNLFYLILGYNTPAPTLYLLLNSRSAITNKLFPTYCFSTKPPPKTDSVVLTSEELPTELSEQQSDTNSDEPIVMKNPYKKERHLCILCKMNITPNYKNVRLLSQFQSPYTGRIYGRHITGLCNKRQEQVELEIIRSQSAGYMGVYHKSVEFLKDPQLFNPEKSIRPHKY